MATKRKELDTTSVEANQGANPVDQSTIRLLLHTVDGAIPYLTPHLLKKCFPIEQVKDQLWIGMSVRDGCIAPITGTGNKKNKKHPNGYTFLSSVNPDPWLKSYTRITVPTFDPKQDAIQFSPKKVANDSTLTSGDQHIMVWTDNGRQKLTKDLYLGAAKGLRSHASVSLFDVCHEDVKDRRRRAALQRTNQWREEMAQDFQLEASDKVWVTCLLSLPGGQDKEDPEMEQQFTSIQAALTKKTVEGVAFVGTTDLLQEAVKRLEVPCTTSLAVLSTNSLTKFLKSYQAGMTIIGTSLPAQWAKAKKAFACNIDGWTEQPQKRHKVEANCLDADCCFQVDKTWIQDDQPILPGCSCLACREHSRAYLYHLVMTKELLSEILLFIHNLHHLLALCRELSQAKKGGKQDEIIQHIAKQIKEP